MPKVCHIDIQEKTHIMRPYREAMAAVSAGMGAVIICEGISCVEDGVQYIGFPKAANRFDRFFHRSAKMIAAALQSDAEIIQLHAPEYLLYALRLKRAGKKVIFDSHENYPIQILCKPYIPKPFRSLISKMYAAFEAYVCKRIDCVIYPSTINGKSFFDGRAKRAVKIENYSRVVTDVQSAETRKAEAIYAGALTRDRGISNLAEAIMKTSGSLILCGPFMDKAYQEEILSSYPPEKLIYKGKLDRKALFEAYGSSAIGLSTLLPVGQYPDLDNLSTKSCEYMQCGLPVVMSNFRFAQLQNEKYHFGICVDPENIDEIADAIQYLFDHPDEARQMGENGRRAVKEEFNWEHEEKKLLALYEELLKE